MAKKNNIFSSFAVAHAFDCMRAQRDSPNASAATSRRLLRLQRSAPRKIREAPRAPVTSLHFAARPSLHANAS